MIVLTKICSDWICDDSCCCVVPFTRSYPHRIEVDPSLPRDTPCSCDLPCQTSQPIDGIVCLLKNMFHHPVIRMLVVRGRVTGMQSVFAKNALPFMFCVHFDASLPCSFYSSNPFTIFERTNFKQRTCLKK